MAVILLGNPRPLHQYSDDKGGKQARPAVHLTKSVTRVKLWDGIDDEEFVTRSLSTDNDRVLTNIARVLYKEHQIYSVAIREIEQLWDRHCGGGKPDWVDGDVPEIVQAIAAYYGCPVGQPTALLTNGGRDLMHAQVTDAGSQPAAFNYVALTASTSTPLVTDTTLPGEISTAGGGLIRAAATVAHTAGTNTTTLTITFTSNGTDVLPVVIAQIGVFNVVTPATGQPLFHTVLSGTATISVPGDNVTVTELAYIG